MSMKRVFILRVTKVLVLIFALALGNIHALGQAAPSQSGAVALYRELLNPSFEAKDVYQVREASIMMEDLHISISDGTLAFTREVNGRITGAMFEGVGEVLLVPPNRAEKTSLALFTGTAVLEQRFQSAYFRFSDDKIVAELRAGLRGHPDDAQEFISHWQEPAARKRRHAFSTCGSEAPPTGSLTSSLIPAAPSRSAWPRPPSQPPRLIST